MEALEEGGVDAKVKRLGIPDEFVEHGSRAVLLEDIGLTGKKIAERVLNWLEGR